jgi:hypothetical protein
MELMKISHIQNRIFLFRNKAVMIDRDLAEMYHVETKVLNQAVKRNIDRFPDVFRFALTDKEKQELVTNCDRFGKLKHSSFAPYAFTEQGVAMLSAVLRSEVAIKVSIQIMNAFVEMRKTLQSHTALFQRLELVERKQLEADHHFEKIFQALEQKQLPPDKGIFFNGQMFDAYVFAADLIKKAQKEIILIDNYLDESVLNLLAKRKRGVAATLYTHSISKILAQDIKKHNSQYASVTIKTLAHSHDRFLIIDRKELYHLGASLKDLGKRPVVSEVEPWFAFSKMSDLLPELLAKLSR